MRRLSSKLLACLPLVGLIAAGRRAPQPPLKLMPLGDSITEGGCWRAYLWNKLTAEANITNIDYVGSMYDEQPFCGEGWARHHEGHGGYRAIWVADTYLVPWLKAVPGGVDVVFFHLGTNDIVMGFQTDEIIDAYGRMVDEIRAAKASTKIIVSQIIPLLGWPGGDEQVKKLIAAVPDWVKRKNTTESPIFMADCNTGWGADDLRDGVHPNDSGDRKMMECLYPQVLKAIRASQSETQRGEVPDDDEDVYREDL